MISEDHIPQGPSITPDTELLRALVDHSSRLLAVLEPDGTVREINAAGLRELASAREELIGHFLGEAVSCRDDQDLQTRLKAALATAAKGQSGWIALNRTTELLLTPVVRDDRDGPKLLVAESREIQTVNAATLAKTNEELNREIGYRRRAEEQHAKFSAIIESSNDAIIAHHLDGTIVTWNKGAERLFGYSSEEAQGRSISMLVPPDVDDELPRTVQAIRRGEAMQHLELARLRKDGTRISVSVTMSPIKDSMGRIVGVSRIARDITQQKQTEQALRESEAKARAILDGAVDGIITIDHAGRIRSFNRSAERLFGYRAGEVLGKNVNMLMPEPDRSQHDGYLRNYMQTGIPKIIGIGRDVVARRKDGVTFPIDLSVSEVQLGDQRLFSGIIHDLSERRLLEKEILEISDAEKRRMGQDLHDGLGQLLTGIGFKSKSLENKLTNKGLPEADGARQLAELINRAITESRAIFRGLQPVALESTGLMSALQDLATHLQTLFKLECSFVCPESVPISDSSTAMHLYRIAQEAANNAIKHGNASSISIALERRDGKLRLAVSDDGGGFVPVAGAGGMGLHIMRYRAAMIGGALSIDSRPGHGTTVCCVISSPLESTPSD